MAGKTPRKSAKVANRAGMKRLINWRGYTVGPTWMSILVGSASIWLNDVVSQRPLRLL